MPREGVPIRLIVLDIDGVLTGGEARPLDLRLLGDLAGLNRAARDDGSRPGVTLCTGRAAPYLEVMLQAIDGHLPGIYENGAGLYLPSSYRFVRHPDLGPSDHMAEARHVLKEAMVDTGLAFFQPGKEFTLTLFATDPADTPSLHKQAASALGPLAEEIDMVYSTACLNILPRGIHKGKGVELLAERSGYGLQEMLGVGDSDVDVEFLDRVGHSAAPANASPKVRQAVDYLATGTTTEGLREILRHFGVLG